MWQVTGVTTTGRRRAARMGQRRSPRGVCRSRACNQPEVARLRQALSMAAVGLRGDVEVLKLVNEADHYSEAMLLARASAGAFSGPIPSVPAELEAVKDGYLGHRPERPEGERVRLQGWRRLCIRSGFEPSRRMWTGRTGDLWRRRGNGVDDRPHVRGRGRLATSAAQRSCRRWRVCLPTNRTR